MTDGTVTRTVSEDAALPDLPGRLLYPDHKEDAALLPLR